MSTHPNPGGDELECKHGRGRTDLQTILRSNQVFCAFDWFNHYAVIVSVRPIVHWKMAWAVTAGSLDQFLETLLPAVQTSRSRMVASENFLVEKPEKTRQSNGSRRNDGNWWKTGSRAADRSSISLTADKCSGDATNQLVEMQPTSWPTTDSCSLSCSAWPGGQLINDQTDLPALADADTIIEHWAREDADRMRLLHWAPQHNSCTTLSKAIFPFSFSSRLEWNCGGWAYFFPFLPFKAPFTQSTL